MGFCIEPLSVGEVGAREASDVGQCSCVLLELLGLPVVLWWVISCDTAVALRALDCCVLLGASGARVSFRLVRVTTQQAEGAHLAACAGCCGTSRAHPGLCGQCGIGILAPL